MTFEQLIEMDEESLKKEHARGIQQNNRAYVSLVNTIRLSRILKSAINIHEKNTQGQGEIPFYHKGNQDYLLPEIKEYEPSIRGHFENVAAAHLGFRYPIPFSLELSEKLVNSEKIRFFKAEKELTFENVNVLNYDYDTTDVVEVKVPDVWVPSGLEELEIAVEDMPKVDEGAILLKGVASRFQIGKYITEDSVFTDVYYSQNREGEMAKAIILSSIMGVSSEELEACLAQYNLKYKTVENNVTEEIAITGTIPTKIDLSTIRTAKTLDVVEAAIEDSEEKEGFSEMIAQIYKTPARILVNINVDDYRIGLKVDYNTIIVFDGKLTFHSAADYNDKDRDVLIDLFKSKGVTAITKEEEIDLTPFINSSNVFKP